MSTATATVVRPPLTKAERAGIILEATAAFITTVLLIWLLLWFAFRVVNPTHVIAYLTLQGDVPYQKADVRGLTDLKPGESVPSAFAAGLGEELARAVGTKGPAVVLSVSLPVAHERGGETPEELIRKVASQAKRHTLIVLDMAQIDSDRELGLYGNAPYRGLEQALQKMPKPDANVAVLLSCAPGQKSWMADELGRSAFSYFVQLGLAGRAWREDGGLPSNSRPERTPQVLHQYVLRNVQNWVQKRRGAVQTPLLLPVGSSLLTFRLPPANIHEPGVAEVTVVATLAAKTKDAASGSSSEAKAETPPPDPRKVLLDDLMKEWASRQDLLNKDRDRPPYRWAPATWRAYESLLLRAERLVRASQNDPDSLDDARRALDDAGKSRGALDALVKQRVQEEEGFPFLPVRNDAKGEVSLNNALRFVTGQKIAELAMGPPSPKPAAAGTEGAGGGSRKVETDHPDEGASPELRDIAAGHPPAPYVEMQLPGWAERFRQEFGLPFKNNPRGEVLRFAVKNRLAGETALAVDRRGLGWIEAQIRETDELRRGVQDELFALGGEPGTVDQMNRRILSYGKQYEAAFGLIGKFHKARGLLEEIAVAAPYYGEWKVQSLVRSGGTGESLDDQGLPPQLENLFKGVTALAEALEAGQSVDATNRDALVDSLNEASEKASRAFNALRGEYEREVNRLVTDRNELDWWSLDDVLRTPLISPIDRKVLLERVVKGMPTPADATVSATEKDLKPGAPGARDLHDPLFHRRAVGLGRLEARLLRVASSRRTVNKDPGTNLEKLEKKLTTSELSQPGDPTALDTALQALAGVTDSVELCRSVRISPPSSPSTATVAAEGATEASLGAQLRSLDLEVRLRPGPGPHPSDPDAAVRELDELARRVALHLQYRRLALDFVSELDFRQVSELYTPAGEIKDRVPTGTLKPVPVTQPLTISADTHKAELAIDVREEKGDNTDKTPIPPGKAFVGVLTGSPASSEPAAATAGTSAAKTEPRLRVAPADSSESGPATATTVGAVGGLVRVGDPVVGGQNASRAIRFNVEQVDSADPDRFQKRIDMKIFYRGRVDETSQSNVAVILRKFADPITIEIAQSERAFKEKYGPGFTFSDQFKLHPKEGYMHFGGKLDYILKFTNNTAAPLLVTIERTWKPLAGEGQPPEVKTEARTIEPKGSTAIADTATAVRVKPEQPMKLTVRVLAEDKRVLQSQEYTFEQLRPEKYLTFGSKKDLDNSRHNPVPVDSVRVYVWRREDDPVTDPILYRDVAWDFRGKPPEENDLNDRGYLKHGGTGIYGFKELLAGEKEVPFRVLVENQEVYKGTFPVP